MTIRIIPRGVPDIEVTDLFFAFWQTIFPQKLEPLQAQVESAWGENSLACLSVRSGLDALLRVWQLPADSEVLVSALTICDITIILQEHGLVAVPIDLDPDTLAVDLQALQKAITKNTKAILLAHLLGTRMDLDGVFAIANRHNLPVLEDCAQAYDGVYRGDVRSFVSFFSLGPIKTATALGGALLRFQDSTLLEKVRACQSHYPIQALRSYRKRVVLFLILRLLANPLGLGCLTLLLRLLGKPIDTFLSQIVKGFPGDQLLTKLRHQPNEALLAVLLRRISTVYIAKIQKRVTFAHQVYAELSDFPRPARFALNHSNWVLALRSAKADAYVAKLQAAGFDATRKASSMTSIPTPIGYCRPKKVEELSNEIFYLPMYPNMTLAQVHNMVSILHSN